MSSRSNLSQTAEGYCFAEVTARLVACGIVNRIESTVLGRRQREMETSLNQANKQVTIIV